MPTNAPCGKMVCTREEINFFQVIGRISIFYATLDVLIISEFFKIIKKDLFTDNYIKNFLHKTVPQKTYCIDNISENKIADKARLNKLKSLFPEIREIEEKRNKYIHGQWVFDPNLVKNNQIKLAEFSAAGLNFKNFTLEELYKELNEIGELQKKVGSLN